MRRYLLDTTPMSAYLSGRPAAVERFVPWLEANELATSILVYAEVMEALRSRANFIVLQQLLRELLSTIYRYSLTYPILDRHSPIRRQLRSPHGSGLIGGIDTLIAATALERDLAVVTCDADLQWVADLEVVLIPRDEFRR